jgi:RNA polymerase sigma-70 factor (ECF subfamily)
MSTPGALASPADPTGPLAGPPSTGVDDHTLVTRAATGDERAFAELVRRHTPLLRSVIRRILHDPTEAEDVVQETFIVAWHRLEDVLDGAAVTGWLVTTARRRSVDRLRAAGRWRYTDLDDSVPGPDDRGPAAVAERASLVEQARHVLAGLPTEQRRCWELRHLHGRSYDEIAAAVGVPRSTVRGLIARARVVVATELVLWR